jgi:hypothetical protein
MSDNPDLAPPTEAPTADPPPAPEPEQPQEQPAPSPEPEPAPEAAKGDEQDPAAKRISRLTARLAQAARERDELAARLAQHDAAARGEAPKVLDAETQALVREEARKQVAQERTQERVQAFHDAGREQYPDWTERCSSLMAMGADPQFAELLVEMKDGAKVAASLADEPDELERIAALKTERARAIALGQYAAKLEAKPAAPPVTVSRAPAPIRPVTGRTQPEFNEYRAGSQQLVDFYTRQALEQRRQAR